MVPPTTEADETAAHADEDASVDDDPSTRDNASPFERRASGPRWPLVALGLAVVFGLVASLMTASYIRLRSDKDTTNEDRTTVATTASRAAEALTSLDADGPNQQQADVIRQLGTKPFIDQYTQGIESIRKTFGPLKVRSIRGQIAGVFVGDIGTDEAEVIVVVDLVLNADTPRVVHDQYLRVHLAKLSGVWKVDNIENLNVALAASGTVPSSTTPTSSTESSSG